MAKEKLDNFFNRNIWIKQDRRETTLRDLFRVGQQKPVSYLKLSDLHGMDINEITRELEEKGLTVKKLSPEESNIASGALYVYDKTALTDLLNKNNEILQQAGWPVDPDEFVLFLKNPAPEKTPLYNVVADAFGDLDNVRRFK